MLLKKRDIDATQGPIFKNFIIFAIPVAVGGIIQTLFNAADMAVLGNMASSVAVASVGATSMIISLLVNTFIGLSGGTQVVLAQAFGEKNQLRINRAVNTSLIMSAVLGVLLMILGLLCADWFLVLTNCPKDCFEGASVYMRIYFIGVPAILIYNFGAAIIRVSGDSQRPLYYLIASGALNVVLNLVLCLIMEQKVAAVAIATVASQVLGAVLVMYRLITIDSDCRFNIKHLSFDFKSFKKILFIGIPCALNSSLYSISNLQIQSAINSFGSAATAGNTASGNFEGIVGSFTNAVGTTALTFIGQNIGAKKPDRIKRTFVIGCLCGFTVGFVLGYGILLFGRPLLHIFVGNDMAAIECGFLRMKTLLSLYFVAAISGVVGATLQAFGYSIVPMLNSIFSVLLLRVIWMTFIYPLNETLETLYFCYFVSWLLNFFILASVLSVIFPRKLKQMRQSKRIEDALAEKNMLFLHKEEE